MLPEPSTSTGDSTVPQVALTSGKEGMAQGSTDSMNSITSKVLNDASLGTGAKFELSRIPPVNQGIEKVANGSSGHQASITTKNILSTDIKIPVDRENSTWESSLNNLNAVSATSAMIIPKAQNPASVTVSTSETRSVPVDEKNIVKESSVNNLNPVKSLETRRIQTVQSAPAPSVVPAEVTPKGDAAPQNDMMGGKNLQQQQLLLASTGESSLPSSIAAQPLQQESSSNEVLKSTRHSVSENHQAISSSVATKAQTSQQIQQQTRVATKSKVHQQQQIYIEEISKPLMVAAKESPKIQTTQIQEPPLQMQQQDASQATVASQIRTHPSTGETSQSASVAANPPQQQQQQQQQVAPTKVQSQVPATLQTQHFKVTGTSSQSAPVAANSQQQQQQELAPIQVQYQIPATIQTQYQSVPGKVSPLPSAVEQPLQQSTSVQVKYQSESRNPTPVQTGATSTQPTVYYQIPGVMTSGVMTVPIDSQQGSAIMTASPNNAENTKLEIPQQAPPPQNNTAGPPQTLQTLPQSGDHIIGMMGTIPIMKIQGASIHYVKKKKGRFSLLQQTPPAMSATNTLPSTGGVESSSPHFLAQPTTVAANNMIPNNIVISTNDGTQSSGPTVVSQWSNVVPAPQTFDGTSAPTVRKKGRFVVTNVKDPGSIPAIQNQQENRGRAQSNESIAHQPPQPQRHPPAQQQTQQQQSQNFAPTQAFVLQQNNAESEQVSQQVQPQSASPFFSLQGTTPLSLSFQPSKGGCYQKQQVPTKQINQALSQHATPVTTLPSDNKMSKNVQPANGDPINTYQPVQTTQKVETPPQTPAKAMPANNNIESPRRTQAIMSKAPSSSEKSTRATTNQNGYMTPKKKPVVQTTRKSARDRNGSWNSVGLGKLSYFLDQMKSEVSDADMMLKTLKTDMKLLREKNKELEAKNNELEKSLKEETSLREKAEARNIELRKKLREGQAGANAQKTPDQVSDEIAVAQTSKTGTSSDTERKLINGSSRNKKAVMAPAPTKGRIAMVPSGQSKPAAKAERFSETPPTNISGGNRASNPVNTAATSSTSTPSKNKLPPVTNSSKKGTMQKDESNNKEAAVWHSRSSSYGQESEGPFKWPRSDPPVAASPSKANGTTAQLRRNDSTTSTTMMAQPAEHSVRYTPTPYQNGGHVSNKVLCVDDFDPMRQTEPDSISGDVVPVFSFPMMNAAPTIFQNAGDPTFQSNNAPLSAQFDQSAFMSENPFVVPITLQQPSVGNGYGLQQQSIMVLPQQQPIMVQQVRNVIAGQFSQAMPNPQTSFSQNYTTNGANPQMQYTQSQQQGVFHSADSFDPLVTRRQT